MYTNKTLFENINRPVSFDTNNTDDILYQLIFISLHPTNIGANLY